MAAPPFRWRGGKSGLHGSTVTDNIRRGQPQGQRHRNDTARLRCLRNYGAASPRRPAASKPEGRRRARLKWCGKSAPRSWQQGRHGKPHREQDQIGTAPDRFPDRRPGRSREVRGNPHPRGMAIARSRGAQNPAYRPSDAYCGQSRARSPTGRDAKLVAWPILQALSFGPLINACRRRSGVRQTRISPC